MISSGVDGNWETNLMLELSMEVAKGVLSHSGLVEGTNDEKK